MLRNMVEYTFLILKRKFSDNLLTNTCLYVTTKKKQITRNNFNENNVLEMSKKGKL